MKHLMPNYVIQKILKLIVFWTFFCFLFYTVGAKAEPAYEESRQAMVADVESMIVDTYSYTGIKALNGAVKAALMQTPRHEFVSTEMRQYAYINQPLPIGSEQTISQPYIVALMTELADVAEDSIVLEIGTGSGYQAAVLAEMVKHVYTIEIIPELGVRAEATLKRLGYENITVKIGDGYIGWKKYAPYDAILVTAAAEEIPEPLIKQLKAGGKLVIPVGPWDGVQSLRVLEKDNVGNVVSRDVLPVGFVPLTRSKAEENDD